MATPDFPAAPTVAPAATPAPTPVPALTARQARRRRMAGMLPTLLTLGNLVSGFAAIIAATKDPAAPGLALPFGFSPLYAACMFILLGMICDGLDGSAARLTRTMSRMGAELDSLADVVTFGIAPAIIACRLVGVDMPFFSPEWGGMLHKAVFGAAAVYASCTALRLARYNTEDASPEAHGGFTGLPSPGAAGAVIGLVMLYETFGTHYDSPQSEMARAALAVSVVVALFLLGLAMVSRLSYTHMINRAFRGRAKIMRLVVVLALVWAAVVKFNYVLPACFLAYALTGPIFAVLRRLHRGKSQPAKAV